MAYLVRQGTTEEQLHEIIALDQMVYDASYCSTYEQVLDRYVRNKDSFLCVYSEEGEGHHLVGYICFYPVRRDFELMLVAGDYLNDSDLPPEVILPWKAAEHGVYVISVVISPEHQHTDAIKCLMGRFNVLMADYARQYLFKTIVAVTVSDSGKRCLEKSGFVVLKENEDQTHILVKDMGVVV